MSQQILDVTSLAALTPEGEFKQPKQSKPTLPCGCLCGENAKRGSHFLQGHDQRLKGIMQRVASGKCYEGERELVARVLASRHPALASSTFAGLIAKLPKLPKAAKVA
jgi:hypothetical protein